VGHLHRATWLIVIADDFVVEAGPKRVDGWSSRRLSFQPTGRMLEYRAALRAAIGRLEPGDGGLSCAFTSADGGRVDVENV
jgi:hypothetical protein